MRSRRRSGRERSIDVPAARRERETQARGLRSQKYKLPANTDVGITESSFVGDTCYRTLQFRAQNSLKPFKIDLIASPDFRFLTRELLDSLVDPEIEEAHKRQALAASLADGRFPSIGPRDAPVGIVIFSDFECPFCAQAAKGLLGDVLPSENGKVRLVFRNFPLAMHPWAREAAETAVCAQRQNEKYFWAFHDYFFDNQREIKTSNLREKALEFAAGIDGFKLDEFKSCLKDETAAASVQKDIDLGNQMGITGTPTLFINGQRLSGYRLEQINTLVRELSGATQTVAQP